MSSPRVRTFPPGHSLSSQKFLEVSPPHLNSTSEPNTSSPLAPSYHEGQSRYYQPFNVSAVQQLRASLPTSASKLCPQWTQWAFISDLLSASERQFTFLGAPNLKKLALIKRLLQQVWNPSQKINLHLPNKLTEERFLGQVISTACSIQSSSRGHTNTLHVNANRLMQALCDLLLDTVTDRDSESEEAYRFQQTLNEFIFEWLSHRLNQLLKQNRQTSTLVNIQGR